MPPHSRRSLRFETDHRRAGRTWRHRQFLVAAALAFLATPSLAIEGVWHGKYVCTQGPTGLTLTVTKTPDGSSWIARFCFCAIEENPRLPTGECELTGQIVPNETVVKFTPWRWISQPEGWEMRPLELWLSADRQHILGRIDAAGCGSEFQLEREAAGGSVQPACQCRMVTSHANPASGHAAGNSE